MNNTSKIKAAITVVSLGMSMLFSFIQVPQAGFITSGEIEYEKSVNMYAKLKKQIDPVIGREIIKSYQDAHPQFYKTEGVLRFWPEGSYYTSLDQTVPDLETTLRYPWAVVRNHFHMQFETGLITSLRDIYGQKFVIRDRKRPILWKYTNEVRDIAGFECKRANGLILDSIYVVAFYSEQIPPPGGPESFNGLPGMILGLALPTENVSWFAKSVKNLKVNIKEPSELLNHQTPMTWLEFQTKLQKSLGVGSRNSLVGFLL
jgi:GLPGLI family protein